MLASYPVSIVNQFKLPRELRLPQGYFRSKLFVNSTSTNPLVSAASPLFSLLERLCLSTTLPKIDGIREKIEHELFAFHSRLSCQTYAQEFVMIANYLLTATIDELLGKNYLRIQTDPPEFKAFTPSSMGDALPEHVFFEIINFIKQRTHQYLDIIELAYYCLVAGFEGEQHVRADGRQTLDNLIEELHQLIKEHRVHKPLRLFKEHSMVEPSQKNYKTALTIGLVAMTTLIVAYCSSHWLLEYKAKQLILSHAVLLTSDTPDIQHG